MIVEIGRQFVYSDQQIDRFTFLRGRMLFKTGDLLPKLKSTLSVAAVVLNA